MFVTDGIYQRVQEFSQGGVYIRTFKDTVGALGSDSQHYGLAFKLDGSELYSCMFFHDICRRAVPVETTEEVFSVAFDSTDFNVSYDDSGGVFVGAIPKPLDEGTDVLIGGAPAPSLSDGDLLRYDSATGLWMNGRTKFSDLSDSLISSPATGQVPVYNATTQQWENAYATIGIYQDADYTGSNSNTAQKIFNESANGAANVAASTAYLMQASIYLRTTGTTSHGLDLLFGGTATLTSMGYTGTIGRSLTSGATTSVGEFTGTGASATVVSGAVATATYYFIQFSGIVRVNGAGTFIPQFKFSAAPGVAPVTGHDSYLTLTPIGANTVTTVGSWS